MNTKTNENHNHWNIFKNCIALDLHPKGAIKLAEYELTLYVLDFFNYYFFHYTVEEERKNRCIFVASRYFLRILSQFCKHHGTSLTTIRFCMLMLIHQVEVLESIEDPTQRLCIATTHLYFHPRGAVVRLIQTAVITRLLQHLKSIYHSEVNSEAYLHIDTPYM